MKNREQRLLALDQQLDSILEKVKKMESQYAEDLELVHPIYRKSAENLLHYLAVRSFEIDEFEEELIHLGFPGLSTAEGHVMKAILNLKLLINSLLNKKESIPLHGVLGIEKSKKLLKKNTKLLFGYKSKKRFTRIMVTLPNTAAEDLGFIRKLLANGMNCARINCAHDTPEEWLKMINNVKTASENNEKNARSPWTSQGLNLERDL